MPQRIELLRNTGLSLVRLSGGQFGGNLGHFLRPTCLNPKRRSTPRMRSHEYISRNDVSLYLSLRRERPMPKTFFDKLWDSHRIDATDDREALLYIDRVCLHERTGSIALAALQERKAQVRRPQQAFCMMDHILDTHPGRSDHTTMPGGEEFIVRTRRHAAAFGIRTFDLGDADQGISHVVSAEQGIALPGLSLVCPDSHTCTLGALGALALGIGSSETEHALVTSSLWFTKPDNLHVVIDGTLREDATAKDLALYLIAEQGTAGGSGSAVEFSGGAVASLSVEQRMTLCNMAVEFGAVTALIAPDEKVFSYVANRPYAPRQLPLSYWRSLHTDAGARFDRAVHIDAAAVEPRITWGTSPEQGINISGRVPEPSNGDARRALIYIGLAPGQAMTEVAIDAAFIGSCTNARLNDLRSAASVLKNRRIASGVAAVCVPASTAVKQAAEAEGIDQVFRAAGFEWRESGCSMCFYAGGETFGPNKRVITTTNRNFENRQGPGVRSHLASPAVVAASAVRGHICSPAML